jgi:hypothetical protein
MLFMVEFDQDIFLTKACRTATIILYIYQSPKEVIYPIMAFFLNFNLVPGAIF